VRPKESSGLKNVLHKFVINAFCFVGRDPRTGFSKRNLRVSCHLVKLPCVRLGPVRIERSAIFKHPKDLA
jgi:hypothetical protein